MRKIQLFLFLTTLLAVSAEGRGKARHSDPPAEPDWMRPQPGGNVDPLPAPAPGSLYSPSGRFGDLARDFRAGQLDDLVTILISDKASAVSSGTSKTSRKSSTAYGINSALGPIKTASTLSNLLGTTGDTELNGTGTTTRQSTISTTLSARVIRVLPNGNLVIEGNKNLVINSEHQTVTVRGVIRPADLSTANQISSDRIAYLEVTVNGKGVVGDSIRRPFFLYRLLLGLLPI